MKLFVGLDVSLEDTHVCVVDETGKRVREACVMSEPEAITAMLEPYQDRIERVGLEASSLSPWLSNTLGEAGLPVVVVEARHMASALGAMRNKTDKNDARGIAQMMRTGWFRAVHVKSDESHRLRILLANRRILNRKFLDVENAIRGTLKVFGVKMTRTTRGRFEQDLRARLADADPMLRDMTAAMLEVRRVLLEQHNAFHKLLLATVREDSVCRRFMSVPGVGPVTALAFKTTIDDPSRFTKSKTVGAHLGLTPRRYQSGTVNYEGRISKCGDREMRTLLYEAASSLLTRVQSWSTLKAWGMSLQRRAGKRRAVVAVARKLAVILHRMWVDGTEFIAGRDPLERRKSAARAASTIAAE